VTHEDYAARLEELVAAYMEADNAEAAARRQLEVAANVKGRVRADMARLKQARISFLPEESHEHACANVEPTQDNEANESHADEVYTVAGADVEQAAAAVAGR